MKLADIRGEFKIKAIRSKFARGRETSYAGNKLGGAVLNLWIDSPEP